MIRVGSSQHLGSNTVPATTYVFLDTGPSLPVRDLIYPHGDSELMNSMAGRCTAGFQRPSHGQANATPR